MTASPISATGGDARLRDASVSEIYALERELP